MHYEAAGLYAWPVNTITKRTKRIKCNKRAQGKPPVAFIILTLKKKKRRRGFQKTPAYAGSSVCSWFLCFSLYKLIDICYKSQQGIGCPVLESWKNTNCQQKRKKNVAYSPEHSCHFKLRPRFSYRSFRLKSSGFTLSFCSIVFVTVHCFQQEITFCSDSRSVN